MSKRWPVIDTHFHVGVNQLITFEAENDLIPWMEEAGIDIQIVCQVNEGFMHKTPEWNPFVGNDYIAKIQNMFSERIIGLGTVNPWLQSPKSYRFPSKKEGQPYDKVNYNFAIDEVERIILELGLNGLKLHPLEHNYNINDPHIINPLMDKLVEMQNRVGRKMIVLVHAAGDSVYNTPTALADLARQYPDILFLMSHCGFVWGGPVVCHTVGPLENVMLDLTTCPQKSVVWETYHKYGATKFTAGTDGPFASPLVKDAIVKDLASNAEEESLIQGGNLAKLLGIPKIEIK